MRGGVYAWYARHAISTAHEGREHYAKPPRLFRQTSVWAKAWREAAWAPFGVAAKLLAMWPKWPAHWPIEAADLRANRLDATRLRARNDDRGAARIPRMPRE